MTWSTKQADLYAHRAHPEPVRIAIGTPRSGKTSAALLGFLDDCETRFSDKQFIISTRSLTQWNSVIAPYIRQFCRTTRTAHSNTPTGVRIGRNNFTSLIAANPTSEERILGITAQGAYIDEAPVTAVNIVEQIITRCSEPEARIVMVGNPQGIHHPFRKRFLDPPDQDTRTWRFTHDDNLHLNRDYVQQQQRLWLPEGSAGWRRNILGEWADEEGLIWPMWAAAVRTAPNGHPKRLIATVDAGSVNPTHALLAGEWPTRWHIIAEARLQPPPQRTHAEQVDHVLDRFRAYGEIAGWIVDPAEPDWALELRQRGQRTTNPPDKHVAWGVRAARSHLAQGLLTVDKTCTELIREMANYVWCEKARQRGEEKPVKHDDHGCDALRYLVAWDTRRHSRAPARALTRRLRS